MKRKIVLAVLLCTVALILGAALVWPAAVSAQSGLEPRFEVHLWDWGSGVIVEYWPTLGTPVTVTVDDPATAAPTDYSGQGITVESGGGYGCDILFHDVDFLPGFEVTVSDGAITEIHTVTAVRVTAVDAAADVVEGTAAPGSEVVVFADPWDPYLVLTTLAEGDRTWMVDFSAVLDILPGATGCAEQLDADGNSTVYHWGIPRPEGWQHNPATHHDYLFVEVGMSWEEAEAYAVSLGGHLVTINDAAENEWLFAAFGTWYWIGLNDLAVEGTWVWASGEPVTFTDWYEGEPNDYLGEDAAVIDLRFPLGWNDIPDSSLVPFVVEVGPMTLAELLDDMVADGALPNAGVANSILKQAQRAPLEALTNHLASLVARGVITQQTMDEILAMLAG